jgi:hypothetical protein
MPITMRRTVIIALVAIALILGSAYYYLYGRKFVYRITETQLQEALAARMPIQKKYFFVIQVTLNHPRVALVEGSDRVNAGLDVELNFLIGSPAVPLGGSLDASGGVRYEPEGGKFYLTNPRIERLLLQGVPEKYSSRAASALTLAIAEYFATHPIYTLNTRDVKQAGAKLVLKSVIVQDRQLVVTLGIGP